MPSLFVNAQNSPMAESRFSVTLSYMQRSFILIGNKSPTFSAFKAEALKRLEEVYFAEIPLRFKSPNLDTEPSAETKRSGEIPLSLTSTSPLACHSLMLDIKNRFSSVSDFFLICSPLSLRNSIEKLNPSDFDRICDDLIKVWYFLAREALGLLRKQGKGRLNLVLSTDIQSAGEDGVPDITGPLLASTFKALASSLLVESADSTVQIYAFSLDEQSSEGNLAELCFKVLDESRMRDSGRWHKFGTKTFFSPRK